MASTFEILITASCDLGWERIQALGLHVVPIPLAVDGVSFQHYPDGRELSLADFYRKLASHADIRTAAPSPQEFIRVTEPLLKAGRDVLYLGISSTLSGTFQSGVIAMKELKERYPERQIEWLDTLSGAMGEALLAEQAASARLDSKSLRDTIQLLERLKPRCAHLFTLDQLDYLRRNGRMPAYQAKIGSLLQIKPILELSAEGRFTVAGKVRTYQKALARLKELVVMKASNLKEQVVYISHADVRKAAEQLAQGLKSAGAREVVITLLGPAIASHFGIGGLGVAFLADAR